jgi:hypothetical protein
VGQNHFKNTCLFLAVWPEQSVFLSLGLDFYYVVDGPGLLEGLSVAWACVPEGEPCQHYSAIFGECAELRLLEPPLVGSLGRKTLIDHDSLHRLSTRQLEATDFKGTLEERILDDGHGDAPPSTTNGKQASYISAFEDRLDIAIRVRGRQWLWNALAGVRGGWLRRRLDLGPWYFGLRAVGIHVLCPSGPFLLGLVLEKLAALEVHKGCENSRGCGRA